MAEQNQNMSKEAQLQSLHNKCIGQNFLTYKNSHTNEVNVIREQVKISPTNWKENGCGGDGALTGYILVDPG